MKDLIEKLEAAECGSRELDAEISCAVKFTDLRPATPQDTGARYHYHPGDIKTKHGALMADHYTTSIDAALTLVPEKYLGPAGKLFLDKKPGTWYCEFRMHAEDMQDGGMSLANGAIAICIAALKARDGE